MKHLAGPIRHYAWGSRTALAALQGRPEPSPEPEAELWLGAHPTAPSQMADGQLLTDAIAANPVATLGATAVERFGARLPYLLKVLAAAQPLSLQAHPDAEQARAGFALDAGLPDGDRRYVDPYHKPEVLVALDQFEALCGFRRPAQSAELLAAFAVAELAPVIEALSLPGEAAALCRAVEIIMRWPADRRGTLVSTVADAGGRLRRVDAPIFGLAADLAMLYPADVGVVLALLLNHVRLQPDEAVFMPAGNLHAYLRGVGIEIMAASDNVLRGGLTPKHVDVEELLRLLRYEVLDEPVLRGHDVAPGIVGWAAPVDEFSLLKATATVRGEAVTVPATGPRILLCVAGPARCRAGDSTIVLSTGEAAFVGAAEPEAVIEAVSVEPEAGAVTVFAASPHA